MIVFGKSFFTPKPIVSTAPIIPKPSAPTLSLFSKLLSFSFIFVGIFKPKVSAIVTALSGLVTATSLAETPSKLAGYFIYLGKFVAFINLVAPNAGDPY